MGKNLHIRLLVAGVMSLAPGAMAQEVSTSYDCGREFVTFENDAPQSAMIWADYGASFDKFLDVKAYSNGTSKARRPWQCTELVHRFVRKVYGFPSQLGLSMGHGKSLAAGIADHFDGKTSVSPAIAPYKVKLEHFENGTGECAPVVGSLISVKVGSFGHAGVLRSLKPVGWNRWEGRLFAQDGTPHSQLGATMGRDKVMFQKIGEDKWQGAWISASGRVYDLSGWTNPVVVGVIE